MAKLSGQLATLQTFQRPTRTQRVVEQQRVERDKKRFAQLKTEAERIQQENFDKIKTEEDYDIFYAGLSTDLKKFFATPTELRQAKAERIATTSKKVDEKLQEIQRQREEARIKYEEGVRKNREWYDRKGDRKSKYRDQYEENDRDLEDDYEEKLAFLQGLEKGLNEGKGQLNSNKDLSYDDIYSYASDVGSYYEEREDARNERRNYERTQLKKIEDLEKQGYKPYVIEQSNKGVLEKVNVSYYNEKTGKWVKINEYNIPKGTDVSKLQTSQLGRTQPITQTLDVYGKKINYTTSLPLFKTSTGDVVTQFGKTGLNENVLIKEAQDKAYSDWTKERSTKPFTLDFVMKEKNPALTSQMTISTEKQYDIIPKDQYLAMQEKKGFSIKNIIPTKVKDWWAENKPKWYLNINPYSAMPVGIGVYPTSNKSIDLTQKVEDLQGKLDLKIQDINLDLAKNEKIAGRLSAVETSFNEQYQLKFEDKYMKDLIYGKKTFEEASAEFKESKEAKNIEKEFTLKYGEEFEKSRREELTRGEKAIAGLKIVGWGSAKTGLSLIKTPTSTALTGVAGVGLYKGLALIPAKVIYGTTAVYTGYSAYKIISPKSSPEEVGSGIIGATVGSISLGYGAYKYLRSPVVTTKVIQPNIKSLTRKAVGVEQATKVGLKYGDKLVTRETVIFGKQKLSRQVIEGRRTIVTSKGRSLLNKYLKFNIKPIYEGIPTAQRGQSYLVESLRGSYTVSTPSAYQKALKRLTKYGYSTSQAKSTLRYYQPRVITQTLQRGRVDLFYNEEGAKAFGKFDVLKEQPIFDVDKNLGIKTRGARAVRDIYEVERAVTGTFTKTVDKQVLSYDVITENIRKTTMFMTRGGGSYNTLRQAGKTTSLFERKSIVNVGEVKEGVIPLDRKGMLFRTIKYQDIESAYLQRQTLPFKRSVSGGKGTTRLIKAELKNYIEFDLDEITGIKRASQYAVSPAKIKKTPFSKTFGEPSVEQVKKIIRDISKQSPSGKSVVKVIEQGQVKTSQYYGTGLYERTEGGLVSGLKEGFVPSQARIIKIKEIILPKMNFGVVSKSMLSVGLLPKMTSKQDYSLKAQLKSLQKLELDTALKSDVSLKSQQSLKQGQSLKQILKQAQISPSMLLSPNLNIPQVPPMRPPTIRPKFNLDIEKKILNIRRRKKTNIFNEYAYLPDFTTRSLGLDPEIISGRDAERKLKKILSGLELRRGVIIK